MAHCSEHRSIRRLRLWRNERVYVSRNAASRQGQILSAADSRCTERPWTWRRSRSPWCISISVSSCSVAANINAVSIFRNIGNAKVEIRTGQLCVSGRGSAWQRRLRHTAALARCTFHAGKRDRRTALHPGYDYRHTASKTWRTAASSSSALCLHLAVTFVLLSATTVDFRVCPLHLYILKHSLLY